MKPVCKRRSAPLLLFLLACLSQLSFATEYFTPNKGRLSVTAGAANYDLPFQLPPAPGRLTPQLGLSYSDRFSHGLLGSRTRLTGIPSISRCGPKKVMGDSESNIVTMTDSDRLCLNGNKLHSTGRSYWGEGTKYRTVIDTYSRITAVSGGFKVEFKNGSVALLDQAVKTHRGARTHAWYPTQVKDSYGNLVEYSYLNGESGSRVSQALPDSITYGNTRINFEYRNGYEIEHYVGTSSDSIVKNRLIKNIEISIANQTVRSYRFNYRNGVPNYSLSSVEECGVEQLGSTQWQCADAAKFEWDPDLRKFASIAKRSVARELSSGNGRWLVDVHTIDWTGNGIQDLITVSAAGRVVLHEGGADVSSNLRARQLLSPLPYEPNATTLKVRTAFVTGDISNNGRSEIVFAEGDFDTNSLTGTYRWRVIVPKEDGSHYVSNLELDATTVSMNGGGQNESAYFMRFFFNVATGIKPIIADLTGDKKMRSFFQWDPLESTCRHASLSIL